MKVFYTIVLMADLCIIKYSYSTSDINYLRTVAILGLVGITLNTLNKMLTDK